MERGEWLRLLAGSTDDSEQVLGFLREVFLPEVLARLRTQVRRSCALFDNDFIPTNERNLTDVRTRMGGLLEYEFAQAVRSVLHAQGLDDPALTYEVAHKFPDLSFRFFADGRRGLRFEIKAVQAVAEEKAANFDTLIKDIRKARDFVVALLWDWKEEAEGPSRYPHIRAAFVFDAYDLALMRDCYWLNRPPKNLGGGRQGFDLRYAVTCSDGKYKKEEGNLGKLMRIFDHAFEDNLPEAVKASSTLSHYYEFQTETYRFGFEMVIGDIARCLPASRYDIIVDGLPFVAVVEAPRKRILFFADRDLPSAPKERYIEELMEATGAHAGVLFNKNFRWRVVDASSDILDEGNKPAGARRWCIRFFGPPTAVPAGF